jgi:hypothetical protein
MSEDSSPALRAFADLVSSGGWVPLDGQSNTVILMHPWPDGSVDTIVLLSEDEALIDRTNPVGLSVWRVTGTVTEVIAALREVPPPFALDAPREPLGDTRNADRDWGTS